MIFKHHEKFKRYFNFSIIFLIFISIIAIISDFSREFLSILIVLFSCIAMLSFYIMEKYRKEISKQILNK